MKKLSWLNLLLSFLLLFTLVFDRKNIGIATAKGARLSGAARLFVEHVRRELAE